MLQFERSGRHTAREEFSQGELIVFFTGGRRNRDSPCRPIPAGGWFDIPVRGKEIFSGVGGSHSIIFPPTLPVSGAHDPVRLSFPRREEARRWQYSPESPRLSIPSGAPAASCIPGRVGNGAQSRVHEGPGKTRGL